MATQDILLTLGVRLSCTVVYVNGDTSWEYRNDENKMKLRNSASMVRIVDTSSP